MTDVGKAWELKTLADGFKTKKILEIHETEDTWIIVTNYKENKENKKIKGSMNMVSVNREFGLESLLKAVSEVFANKQFLSVKFAEK